MSAIHLAISSDVVAWADRPESRSEFPELVRRLVIETAGPSRLSFRAQGGADLGGYDGWVETPADTAHVPADTSGDPDAPDFGRLSHVSPVQWDNVTLYEVYDVRPELVHPRQGP